MTFSITYLANSLAAYLSPYFPNVNFYRDPNQQGTTVPAMFLQMRYSTIKLQPSGRYLRKIGLDLTYLEDYNRPDLQEVYLKASEQLDIVMETFPIISPDGTAIVRTYNRDVRVDLDALHYKFDLEIFVYKANTDPELETIEEYNTSIKE